MLAGSLLPDQWYRWGAIALLAIAAAPWRELPKHGLTLAVGIFCGWTLLNALFISPAYLAEAVYRPIILFCAFVAAASLGHAGQQRLFRAGVAVMTLMVALAMAQHFFGGLQLQHNAWRAAGTFVTPNTFAAAINLFLLPLVVAYLLVPRSPLLLATCLWLFAGLVASQSRGGMLALIAGLGYIAFCIGRSGARDALAPALRLITGGAIVWAAMLALGGLAIPHFHAAGAPAPSLEAWTGRATWDRAEIFATTWRRILEQPFAGAGAAMFWPEFEQERPEVFSYRTTFFYAHNDYLQIWLEYGVLGLLALLALVGASLWTARAVHQRSPANPLPLACGAALASCFAHAVVDFPLYVIFTLMVAGCLMGALASAAVPRRATPRAQPAAGPQVRAVLVFAALLLMAQPMAAELAGAHGVRMLARGDVQAGLYWHAVARRMEPRKPLHYWAESVIWWELGRDSGDRRHFAMVDRLLSEGIAANPPYATSLLLDRARLHRRHGDMLDNAAGPEEIVLWVNKAMAMAPLATPTRMELARSLAYAGRKDEARQVAQALLSRNPDSPRIQALMEELK